MRCKKEEFVEGAVFHIYHHSIAEINLFKDDEDYEYFLKKFKSKFALLDFEIYAYCLMPNHFHFCLRQNSDNEIYKIFNSLSTSYAMYYNRKYKRKGKVFWGKLQHRQLLTDNYLLTLCQYIHYNPVKAGIAVNVKEWEYSNYPEYSKNRNGVLFSKKLLQDYPLFFENYENKIAEYEKNILDKKFAELLFD